MINKGTLIYDNDPAHTLFDCVAAACSSHVKKFGVPANVVYVNPEALGTELTTVMAGVSVVARRWILLHHYYAVREEPGWDDH